MSRRYEYVQLNNENKDAYIRFLPTGTDILHRQDVICIGLSIKNFPCGAVALQKDGKTLSIRSLRLDDGLIGSGQTEVVLKEVCRYAAKLGYTTLECRYADDEPGFTESIMRDAGFTVFEDEAVVYGTDAYTLGSLLRDGPDAALMYASAIELMHTRRVRCFTTAGDDLVELFYELYPVNDLSFLTINTSGICESFIVVSQLSDGSPYLADMRCNAGRENDIIGLLYMTLGKVFMSIEPDGEFFIPAVMESFKEFAEFFFAPVRPMISIRRLIRAQREL